MLDGKTGKYLVKTGSRTQSVMDVNFSPDSNLMTVLGADGRSLLFDLDGRKMIAQLKGESGWATDTVIRPGNRFAVTVTASGRILLWDIAQDQKTATYPGHPTIALNALLTRDNEHVITSADDGTVRLWKLPADPEERESLVSQFRGRSDLLAGRKACRPVRRRRVRRAYWSANGRRICRQGTAEVRQVSE